MNKYVYILALILFASCTKAPEKNSSALAEEQNGKAYDTLKFREQSKKIHSFFEKLHHNYNFNGTVLVGKEGHVLYKEAFGWADIPHKKDSLQTASVFQLASVSKQFTAAAILKLSEEKKLHLNDNIQKFYPEFPYSGITLKMLLNHRGGLGNYTYFSEKYCDRYTPLSNQDVVQMMITNRPAPYFFPDKRFDYSNTGYVLLAAIVEKVTGKTFKEYMEEEIFAEAGMKNSFIYDIHHPDAFNYVNGHKAFRSRTYPDYLDGTTGDKGVYSTVEDLFKWDHILYTEKILKQSTIDSAFVPGSKNLKGPFNYGYGWRTYTFKDGKKMIYHGGWWNGYKSFFLRDINHHVTVIILSNMENSGFRNLDELFDIIYERKPSPMRKFSAYLHHSPGF
jgi:CubicO group peptidase (beta-lactamase class C family)